jgi:hypothetical protein
MDMDFNNIITEALSNEAKKIILESEGTVIIYHIHCDNEPVDSFEDEDTAMRNLDIYKKDNPNKEFSIVKSPYNSYGDMLDKLSEMGETTELKENKKMGKQTVKVKTLGQAILDAKERGLEEIKINGETYNVMESWKELSEGECNECGYMEEETDVEENAFVLAADAAKDAGEEEFEFPKGSGKMHKVTIEKDIDVNEGMGECNECGGELNEEGMCNECGTSMNESKKRTLRLTESELIQLISKMVNESVPGIEVTKKAQSGSKKDNDENMMDVEKKLKDYASFDGNDNPEFPNQEGQGEDKEARQNTSEEDEFVADNRGGGLEDLNYDNEPSDMFKERLRMALSGDAKMGNSQEYANVIKSDLGQKIAKKVERRRKSIEDAPMYNKDVQPVNESLERELLKIKNLTTYDKRTQ